MPSTRLIRDVVVNNHTSCAGLVLCGTAHMSHSEMLARVATAELNFTYP
jgi:hypothetical protein